MLTEQEWDDLFNKKVEEKDPNEITETLSIEQGLIKIRESLMYD